MTAVAARLRRLTLAPLAGLLLLASGLPAAILTVGVGGGCPCTYATINAAYAAAASGDTIELKSNMAEDLNMGRGINIYFTSDTGSRVWDGANDGNPTLTSTNGNGAICNITGLTMNHSSASGGFVLYFPQHDVTLTVSQSILERTSTSTTNNAIYNPGPDSPAANFSQVKFYGNAYSIGIQENAGNDDEVDLVNCTLSGFNGTTPNAGYAIWTNNGNQCFGVNMMNCTLENNTVAYWDNYNGTNTPSHAWYITNCLFILNGQDLRVAPNESMANTYGHMSYNAFSQQATNGSFGAGNIFGVIPANEVINPSTSGIPNLHLKGGAQSIDHAVNTNAQGIASPNIDMDGVHRPQGPAKDIGAYEGFACGVGYLSNVAAEPWAMSTPVCIFINSPTATVTPTYTASPTPSITPSVTITLTPQATFTVTPLMQLTKTSNVAVATIGDTVTYCLNWKNDATAAEVMLIWDTVPAYLTYLGCNSGCSVAGTLVSWNLGSQASGASGQVCFWGTVNSYPYLPRWDQDVVLALAILRDREDGWQGPPALHAGADGL